MMTTAASVLAHEIIGLDATIAESTDPSLRGLKGAIVFETKNTIWMRTARDSSIKQIAKSIAKSIEIKTHSGACFISGSSLIGRPEDRISRLNN